jgi:sulfite reductase alpha subunit-like flavoprotein
LKQQSQSQQQQQQPAPCVLFFGCRHPDKDFYYREEWEHLRAAGALEPSWGLVAAFSRPGLGADGVAGGGPAGGAGAAKEYVTHKLRQHGDKVRCRLPGWFHG